MDTACEAIHKTPLLDKFGGLTSWNIGLLYNKLSVYINIYVDR